MRNHNNDGRKMNNVEAILLYLHEHGPTRAHVLRKMAYENSHGVGSKMPNRGWYCCYFRSHGYIASMMGKKQFYYLWTRVGGHYDTAKRPTESWWELTREGRRRAKKLKKSLEREQGFKVE